MKINKLLLTITLSTLSVPMVKAQTVAWGSSVSINPLAFNSNGSIDNGGNLWTLGYFTTGFNPDTSNYSQWGANWNIVSATVTPSVTNDPIHKLFPASGNLPARWAVSINTEDVGVAAAGKQVYVFAYNDLNLIGTASGEALLYRETGTLFPTIPNQITFDIADNLADPIDDGFDVIWGRVDRNLRIIGGTIQGGGEISSIAAETVSTVGRGTAEAQFATWPIPEPSSSALAFLGSVLLLRRRR